MDTYRAVPVKFLPSRNGMCASVRGSRYLFDRPKSMRWTKPCDGPKPIRKLSGLMSLQCSQTEAKQFTRAGVRVRMSGYQPATAGPRR